MGRGNALGLRGLGFILRGIGLAVLIAAVSAASGSAAVQQNRYGVVSSMNGFWLSQSAQSTWGPQLSAMRGNGVQTVRSDAAWADIQPQAPGPGGAAWEWAHYDAWVSALASHKLTWEPVLDYNTSWASAVSNNAAFATFAQAVAARYGANGTFWKQNPWLPYEPSQIFELWNEENGSQWYISAQNYGPLYTAVHTAIHAVVPSASVDVGGLSDSGAYNAGTDYPSWYLVSLFGYYPQLENTIDGYALHPYGPTASDQAQWVMDFRHTLSYYHVAASVPIDVTEFGWQYISSNESWRASQMNSLGSVFARSNCGIRDEAPYDWVNPNQPNDDFGFVDLSNTSTALRPAGTAWFNALASYGAQPMFSMC